MRGRLALTCMLAASGCFSIPAFTGRGDADAVVDTMASPTHDEDGDLVVDNMDTCPVTGGAQTDTDEDGVGDLCDPDPNNFTEKDVARLYTFETTGTAELFVDGTLLQNEKDTIDLGALGTSQFIYAMTQFKTARVEIAFKVIASDPQTTQPELGLLTSHPPLAPQGNDDGDTCFVGTMPGTALYVQAFENANKIGSDSASDPTYQTDLAGHFVLDHSPTTLGCGVDQLSPSHAAIGFMQTTSAPTLPGGRVGVKIRNSVVRLKYLYIVGKLLL